MSDRSLARALHAMLVASVLVAALALIDALGAGDWHRSAGYAAAAVAALQVARAGARRRLLRPGAVARVLCVLAIAFTGWLYGTDAYWGNEAVEQWHRALAWLLLALVGEHWIDVARTAWRRRRGPHRAAR